MAESDGRCILRQKHLLFPVWPTVADGRLSRPLTRLQCYSHKLRHFPPISFLIMFVDALLQALDHVDEVYYGNGRWNRQMYPQLTPAQAAQLTRFVTRRIERTFCYELYHQLRLVLPDPNDNDGATLQAELLKSEMPDWLADLHGLQILNSLYFPDFLYHRPFAGDRQVAVMEVKAKRDVSGPSLISDINKLGEFFGRYRYEVAIMLAVNSEPARTAQLIFNNRAQIQDEVRPDRVFVVGKYDSASDTVVLRLDELLEAHE